MNSYVIKFSWQWITPEFIAGGLYFLLRGILYLPGSTVFITDIGTAGSNDLDQPGGSLLCVTITVNTQCCRGSDGGALGDWFFPNGTQVRRGNGAGLFFRTGSAQQVRLNRMSDIMAPVGAYECRVPDSNGVEQVAVMIILLSECFVFVKLLALQPF